jgi:hypothetical protein
VNSGLRNPHTRGHFNRTEPLRLAQIFETITELQQQLVLQDRDHLRGGQLVNALTIEPDFSQAAQCLRSSQSYGGTLDKNRVR